MLLTFIEKGLNHALALDTRSRKRLERLQGKYLEIAFTQPALSTYLFFLDTSIRLHTSLPESIMPDAIISGPLRAFILLALRKDIHAAKEHGLKITGDMDLGRDIQSLLMELEMDWEEPLSAITGDVFAHSTGKMLKRFQHKAKILADSLFQNIAEYCTEEAHIVPTETETNEYIRAVDELRCDLDRLSANIAQLKNRELSS